MNISLRWLEAFLRRDPRQTSVAGGVVVRAIDHEIGGTALRVVGVARPRDDGTGTRASLLVQVVLPLGVAVRLRHRDLVSLRLHACDHALEPAAELRCERVQRTLDVGYRARHGACVRRCSSGIRRGCGARCGCFGVCTFRTNT